MNCEFEDNIFDQQTPFDTRALRLFAFQYQNNEVYRQYCDLVKRTPADVDSIENIPFIPISFFKSQRVTTTGFEAETVFESSGTTGAASSRHYVRSVALYEESFLACFRKFYGEPADFCILGLLPSYLERGNSSLVLMVDRLITLSKNAHSGFYLNNQQSLFEKLQELESKGQQTLLIGVTFALLDFADQYPLDLVNTIVMETGGMKGRREELTRDEVHEHLKDGLGIRTVHSEYGMTELLSQAYSNGNGVFACPHWMKVLVREEDDPFKIIQTGRGALNVIDLANIYSCAFIATDDRVVIREDGGFQVLGRLDASDIRGCSQLAV